MKGRRHLHLPGDVLEDMARSGIDISEWAANAWIESKYSLNSLEEDIKKKEGEIVKLKKLLEENKKFIKEFEKLTDKKEINLLAQLDQQLSKSKDDLEKQEELYVLWKNKYYFYFKKRVSISMVKVKLERYKKQIKGEK